MRIRSIGTTLAFCVVGAAVAIAANPQIGTWKLNESKSQLPGVARNNLVVYTEAGDNVKVATDARSYKVVNATTLAFETKKAGKVLLSGTIVVSADGKSRTVASSGTNAKGEKVTQTAVYDKQ